jgi:hypothetical protein
MHAFFFSELLHVVQLNLAVRVASVVWIRFFLQTYSFRYISHVNYFITVWKWDFFNENWMLQHIVFYGSIFNLSTIKPVSITHLDTKSLSFNSSTIKSWSQYPYLSQIFTILCHWAVKTFERWKREESKKINDFQSLSHLFLLQLNS